LGFPNRRDCGFRFLSSGRRLRLDRAAQAPAPAPDIIRNEPEFINEDFHSRTFLNNINGTCRATLFTTLTRKPYADFPGLLKQIVSIVHANRRNNARSLTFVKPRLRERRRTAQYEEI
jgi:hypothetical protein